MSNVYITIDTEYSSGLVSDNSPAGRADNFARSITCRSPDGEVGIAYQLDVLSRYGHKAVFFVDPMPALLWGVAAIEDILVPILEAGQDIQLHCHTEWLELAGSANPLGARTGQNLYDFTFDEQCRILDYARSTLIAAGAPKPIAFRAGNYGADDNSLRALAELGIAYDSSHCPALIGTASRISLGAEHRHPIHHCGIIEAPVGSIASLRGGQRHAQITALSLAEMKAAIEHTAQHRNACFTLVSHSFELFNRNSCRANQIVRRRFEGLCRALARMPQVQCANYREDPPRCLSQDAQQAPLPGANPLLAGARMAEQFLSNRLYGAL